MKKLSLLLALTFLFGVMLCNVCAQGLDSQDYATMKAAHQSSMSKVKSLKSKAITKQRPDHVNNALFKYFPPIIAQVGGSCASVNYASYVFANELNSYRDLDASFAENQIPSHFVYLLTFTGGQGSSRASLFENLGSPSALDYGGQTTSKYFGVQDRDWPDYGWMQGYDKWYRAILNRSDGDNTISYLTQPESQEQIKNWLWNHDGDEDFHGGGMFYIVIAAGPATAKIPITETNRSIGVAGKKYVCHWGHDINHANTIVGYDDRVEFDLDSNGVVGEKEKGEVGAWIIANSWGDGWEDKGFCYCPYSESYQSDTRSSQLYGTRIYIKKNPLPKRVMKIKMDYSKRSMICLSATCTSDTASQVSQDSMYFEHFRYSGDGTGASSSSSPVPPEVPMLGKWGGKMNYEPMEFAYNLDALTDGKYDMTKPIKYWFNVHTKEKVQDPGVGHIYNVSIMDYEHDPEGIEIPAQIESIVNINGSGTLFRVAVVVPGEETFPPQNVVISGDNITWQVPQSSLLCKGFNIYSNGKLVATTESDCTSYSIAEDKGSNFAVTALYECYGKQFESQKSTIVTRPISEKLLVNHVLVMKNGRMVIPNLNLQKSKAATIEYWLKPYSFKKYGQSMGPGEGLFYSYIYNNRGAFRTGWSTSYYATASNALVEQEWIHVAITVDDKTVTLYLNGVQKDYDTSYSTSYKGFPALVEWQIGALENEGLMDGEIDEFRLWNKARTVAEIKNDMYNEIVCPALHPNLVSYLKMETIEDEGELKIKDYAFGNHAIVDDWSVVEQKEDNNLLQDKSQMLLSISGAKVGLNNVNAGERIALNASLSSNVTSIEWTDSESNNVIKDITAPVFTFNTVGKQTITVKAKDIKGNEKSQELSFFVYPIKAPVVDFTMSQTSLPMGEKFSFVNRSNATNAKYVWSMPGAQIEEYHGTNAVAAYDNVGTFKVTLTATNSAGSTSVTKEVNVVKSAPAINFEVKPYNILLGDKTYLIDKTKYDPFEWKWDIEKSNRHYIVDGQNSSYTPIAPGYYNVSQTATNDTGTSKYTMENAFVVSNADSKTGLHFDGTGTSVEISTSPVVDKTTSFTIDFWMNPDKLDGAFTFSSADGTFSTSANSDGSVNVKLGTKTVKSDIEYVLTNSWHHYAIVYKSSKITFYRDTEVFSAPSTTVGLSTKDWQAPFTICNPDVPFSGYYDEFHFWSKNLTQNKLAEYANSPILNVDSVKSADKLLIYYDFNQSGGDVIDRTGNGYTGLRKNFGPDGDAWTSSLGVFTLDLDKPEGTGDVTSKYLTNVTAPFLNAGKTVNRSNSSRFLAIKQGTADSGWKLANEVNVNNILGGVHVDKDHHDYFTVESGWSSFPTKILDHKAYQTIDLPAGFYTFYARPGDGIEGKNYLVATLGDSLNSTAYLDEAIAYSDLDTYRLDFKLEEDATISLGVLFNMDGKLHTSLSGFSLDYPDYGYQKADGLVDSYQAVKAGKEQQFSAVEGGVKIIAAEKMNVRIFNIEGQCIFNDFVEGIKTIPLSAGIYAVNGVKIEVRQ
ncbi:MAG: DUF5013 domain-containing protein [Prevotellaceae bacterium]|nr:DUF5013 domain-containing protein [Candidatus Faecinaster equi]